MANDIMYGPALKLERAEHHIRDVEAIFKREIARSAQALRRPSRNRRRQIDFVPAMDKKTATIIGDAVHNLRVSLDHAYWIAVERNGGEFHRTVKFPFGGDRTSVSGSLKGQSAKHKPAQEVIDYILDEVEPFPGGKLELYDLHVLDITDKHQILLPARASITFSEEHPLVIRNAHGEVELTLSTKPGGGETTIILQNENGFLFSFGNGAWPDYKGNLQTAISVLFGEGPMANRPIAPTLRSLMQNTTDVVKALGTLVS